MQLVCKHLNFMEQCELQGIASWHISVTIYNTMRI
jgi:hypothetical protein